MREKEREGERGREGVRERVTYATDEGEEDPETAEEDEEDEEDEANDGKQETHSQSCIYFTSSSSPSPSSPSISISIISWLWRGTDETHVK